MLLLSRHLLPVIVTHSTSCSSYHILKGLAGLFIPACCGWIHGQHSRLIVYAVYETLAECFIDKNN